MRTRAVLPLLAVAFAALAAALPAAGKDGVEARLTTPVPLHARPGTRLGLAWTLSYLDGQGRRRPFGASGVFVRLVGASGARTTAVARGGRGGRYRAEVRVPRGGIRAVQIGLRGWSDGPSGRREADALFPIANDPLPGPGGRG